jgi:hypothetical protein
MAKPTSKGVEPEYCSAARENTGRIINKPNIRSAKILARPVILRFSSEVIPELVFWFCVIVVSKGIFIGLALFYTEA